VFAVAVDDEVAEALRAYGAPWFPAAVLSAGSSRYACRSGR
jgi:hypothetical protein